MVEEDLDTDHTTVMLIIPVDPQCMVVVNHPLMDKETMLTDTSLMLHGDQVVMEHSMVVEVLEDVKESS